MPPLVERALALAAELGFAKSCSPEAGRLLHLLAAQRGRERVGEIGTGAGVGAAWLASALAPGVSLWTAEADPELARGAAGLFADDPDVHVLAGSWREVLPEHAPFDLLFYDGGGKQRPDLDGDQAVALLAPGGLALLDDLTPGLPGPDPVREFWLDHPLLHAVELLTSHESAAILAVRRSS